MHGAIIDFNFIVYHPGQGMFHPVGIITLRVIFPRMAATAFMAVAGGSNRYAGLTEQVIQFQGFNQVGIPDHGFVFYPHIGKRLLDFRHGGNAFIQCGLRPEYGRFALHGFLHVQTNIRRTAAAVGIADFIKTGQRFITGRLGQWFLCRAGFDEFRATDGGGSAEDDQIQ